MPWNHACRTEVIELHQFFQDWALGVLPDTDEAFSRLTDVLADDFAIVSPDGRVMKRGALLEGLRARNGAERGRTYRIWIENESSRAVAGGSYLDVYEEWQESGGQTKGRLSTAVFVARADAPNGVVWAHVHETWLP